MARPVVILFARAPRLGQVKRRLARDIGAVAALRFYRNQLARMRREISRLRDCEIIIALTPRGAKLRPARHETIMAQSQGDLSQRMEACFNQFRHRRVILVGVDIPGLNATMIRDAAKRLRHHDAAFGPALDGGYYLVAMGPRRPAKPFANMRASSPYALADTLTNFRTMRVARLAMLQDVDTGADLKTSALQWR
ncbi:MAG: hypothetical protein B7Z75_06865 [Acidocella sp. 20-57-95]|nr:MAG: hypothetical protein B7Z75_06865 [Acidocella sp. 20-57-95]OYV58645.1 MAG: hypothetical protein B7Z71_09740 [Acidocella sp. 21-58-7]HQT63605.1 TIGR04282 family arsenosugar biosynthesis glycosyltransferase [Acidocella sp.]HQU05099.1 TIGR04282 family arsenosugar biosynthesis glycosyltransferase [Acidocella sp.]